jgi:phosphonate transport system ATP-binding protein
MALLAELNRELGVTIVVSLHQVEHAFEFCPRTVALRAGEVVFDGPTRTLDAPRLRALYGTQSEELFATAPNAGEPADRPVTALVAAAHAA